jgi:acyl dehydratase
LTGTGVDVPQDLIDLYGKDQYEETSEIPVEHGYIWTSCSSVENGNPIFWDDAVAEAITGGPIAPPCMVSVWFRPHHWAPGRSHQLLPLQVHFDLKERLGLPEAVMTDDTIEFHEPVRLGDLLRTHQVLRSVSRPKETKLGEGRFWVIDVVYRNQRDELVAVETYTGFGYRRTSPGPVSGAASASAGSASPGEVGDRAPGLEGEACSGSGGDDTAKPSFAIGDRPRLLAGDVKAGVRLPKLSYDVTATTVVLGALATRDWRPMHHDKDFAVERNGTRDIFLNTPNQAAWFERFITDWTGPHGRLGRIGFRMKGSVFPGDTMVLRGEVVGASNATEGIGWVDLALELAVGDAVATSASARVALPAGPNDNPWLLRAERWNP